MFSPGLRLHDRFTLVARVGAGGMSEVWRATDDLLGRDVAVKALIAPLAGDPDLREVTWREARAAARLSHPNVTQVHDYGEVPLPGGGTAGYLVMELVDGQTLAARLATGPIPWPEAVRVGAQVAAALAAAHRLGVVHRDVKPGNVMLTDSGVKVLDFGISAVAGRVDTDPGRLLGTPRYAAPERFDPAAPAQPASDVYSLGLLLTEALSGALPEAQPRTLPAVPPGLPPEVTRWCWACLSPDPSARPGAAEVAAGLARAAAAGEAVREPVTAAGQAPRTAAGEAGRRPSPTMPLPHRAVVPVPGGPVRDDEPVSDEPVSGGPAPGGQGADRGGRWRLLAGLAAVLVVAGAGLALLWGALGDSADSGADAAPEPSGRTTAPSPAAPGPPSSQDSAAPPEPSPGPPAGPDAAAAVVSEFDRAVVELFEQGVISRDTHDDLRDDLDELREALAEDPEDRDAKLRDEAAELREEIEELRDDGAITRPAADRLTGVLSPLLRA